MNKKIILIIFSIFAFLIIGKMSLGILKGYQMSKMGPPPVTISTSHAEIQNWPKKLESVGTVEAVRAVVLATEIGGVVENIGFESGSLVQKGTLLIELNSQTEQAQLENAKAVANLAHLNLNRTKTLAEKDYSSKAQLDKAKADFNQANAQTNQVTSTIAKKNITAPFDGILGIRQITLGEYIPPGTPIVTLSDLSKIYVNFSRPEQDLKDLQIGQHVEIKIDSYPDKTFKGILTSIDPQIDSATRSINFQASFDNSDHLLRPGMFANVSVLLFENNPVITIPETAVDYSLYGSVVYVINTSEKDKTTAIQRMVKILDWRDGKALISEGVQEGDEVITAGQQKLYPNAQIIINNEAPLIAPETLPRS